MCHRKKGSSRIECIQLSHRLRVTPVWFSFIFDLKLKLMTFAVVCHPDPSPFSASKINERYAFHLFVATHLCFIPHTHTKTYIFKLQAIEKYTNRKFRIFLRWLSLSLWMYVVPVNCLSWLSLKFTIKFSLWHCYWHVVLWALSSNEQSHICHAYEHRTPSTKHCHVMLCFDEYWLDCMPAYRLPGV